MNSGMTLILITLVAFAVTALLGFVMIPFLHKLKFGQTILDIGPAWHKKKQGTPTMGGVMFIIGITAAVVIGVSTLWLSPAAQGYLGDPRGNIKLFAGVAMALAFGAVGFLDDYIKVVKHRNLGLTARQKYLMQLVIGVFYLVMLYIAGDRSTAVAVPFLGTLELGPFYYLLAMIIITGFVNAVNLTDGLDGLATGVSVPIVAVLGVLAYLSGHIVYADYLNIMYIPDSGELVVFAAAFAGALVGFLWYNSFPAQIFMGDTGSLSIGGIIAVFALCIRKELLLPLLCGVFLVESFSVMMQVGWFKYTKRRYGEGRRILLMSPVHHHYQKKGIFETKIVLRFWIISLLLAAITLVTLKIR